MQYKYHGSSPKEVMGQKVKSCGDIVEIPDDRKFVHPLFTPLVEKKRKVKRKKF